MFILWVAVISLGSTVSLHRDRGARVTAGAQYSAWCATGTQ